MTEEKTPEQQAAVDVETELKQLIVNYVGESLEPENDEVTVDMVVEIFAKEFPDFLLVVAEENFIRGYTQALADVESTTDTAV